MRERCSFNALTRRVSFAVLPLYVHEMFIITFRIFVCGLEHWFRI